MALDIANRGEALAGYLSNLLSAAPEACTHTDLYTASGNYKQTFQNDLKPREEVHLTLTAPTHEKHGLHESNVMSFDFNYMHTY